MFHLLYAWTHRGAPWNSCFFWEWYPNLSGDSHHTNQRFRRIDRFKHVKAFFLLYFCWTSDQPKVDWTPPNNGTCFKENITELEVGPNRAKQLGCLGWFFKNWGEFIKEIFDKHADVHFHCVYHSGTVRGTAWINSTIQKRLAKFQTSNTHTIHVWYIYLHLVDLYGKCRQIYHTWMVWDDFSHWPEGISRYLTDKHRKVKFPRLDRFGRPCGWRCQWCPGGTLLGTSLCVVRETLVMTLKDVRIGPQMVLVYAFLNFVTYMSYKLDAAFWNLKETFVTREWFVRLGK